MIAEGRNSSSMGISTFFSAEANANSGMKSYERTANTSAHHFHYNENLMNCIWLGMLQSGDNVYDLG